MANQKMMRLSQAAIKLNVGIKTLADHLSEKGISIGSDPNARITPEQFNMLLKDFESSMTTKEQASGLTIGKNHNENIIIKSAHAEEKKQEDETELLIKNYTQSPIVLKDDKKKKPEQEPELIKAKLPGLKIIDKIDLKPAKTQDSRSSRNTSNASNASKPEVSKASGEKKVVNMPKVSTEGTDQNANKSSNTEGTGTSRSSRRRKSRRERKAAKMAREQAAGITPQNPPLSVETAKVIKNHIPKEEDEDTVPTTVAEILEQGTNPEANLIEAKAEKLQGLTVLGKIELPDSRGKKKIAKPVASSDEKPSKRKRKRRRSRDRKPDGTSTTNAEGTTVTTTPTVVKEKSQTTERTQSVLVQKKGDIVRNQPNKDSKAKERPKSTSGGNSLAVKKDRNATAKSGPATDKEIQDKIKDTLARLSGGKGGKQQMRRQIRKDKRTANLQRQEAESHEGNVLKVTEFISANDLAVLMEVSVNEVISKCLQMGMFVSINQRLDAEQITFIADEFGYDVEFISAEQEIDVIFANTDDEADLITRAPVVTIMGHVDHGKTSLLDHIRNTKVAEGEAGGITQHVGAYNVQTSSGRQITFLDTPGHEAFTAMRARGAKVTDVAVIVVAADDSVMPQTIEAINHAQVAGVPIVIAINKVDKAGANPQKIKEELAKINILVDDWGGKVQCQEISAKKGLGIEDLLEKVLFEADLLNLRANPSKKALGAVIEARLDKGKGYVSNILIQGGTLRVGDIILAGANHGRVKAMYDHKGKKITEAGPSTPVQVLGLDGAPQAGDKFNAVETEREAKDISSRRAQILREQSIRTTVRPTLSDIGRRIALGNFKQLNIILKGDVDGSIEALWDSLLKLSTEEIEIRIIHKAVGQISESDVLLATASDAIIIGFQVRPSVSARRLAEKEEVEIRLYSIIYDVINEVKAAMEGMLSPTIEEVILGNIDIREIFKISKVGTVAGCYVTEGVIKRNAKIRVVRDGIVVYGQNDAEIQALKRFKEDVSEVKTGFECGLSVRNFNDLKVGDVIEAYEQREVKRKLS